jgi:hypothetical protein
LAAEAYLAKDGENDEQQERKESSVYHGYYLAATETVAKLGAMLSITHKCWLGV